MLPTANLGSSDGGGGSRNFSFSLLPMPDSNSAWHKMYETRIRSNAASRAAALKKTVVRAAPEVAPEAPIIVPAASDVAPAAMQR